MQFVVRTLPNSPDTVEVGYDCPCGCTPQARYERGTDRPGHEHCCCGRVHFAGLQAEQGLQSYLAERKDTAEDIDLTYTLSMEAVSAPWGESIPVAYAVPDKLQEH